jgi:hypothetical protein
MGALLRVAVRFSTYPVAGRPPYGRAVGQVTVKVRTAG